MTSTEVAKVEVEEESSFLTSTEVTHYDQGGDLLLDLGQCSGDGVREGDLLHHVAQVYVRGSLPRGGGAGIVCRRIIISEEGSGSARD